MIVENPSSNTQNKPDYRNKEGINYLKLFFLMLSNWPWFVIVLAFVFLVALLYIKYTPPKWRVSAKVLIMEDQNNQSPIQADQILKGFGLMPGMGNLDNQLNILTSWTIVDQTLNDLPFDIECYHRGLFKKVPL